MPQRFEHGDGRSAPDQAADVGRWRRIVARFAEAAAIWLPLGVWRDRALGLIGLSGRRWQAPGQDPAGERAMRAAIREEVARLQRLVDHCNAGQMRVVYVLRCAGTESVTVSPGSGVAARRCAPRSQLR